MTGLSGKIVIATHNLGKLAEMQKMLAPYGLECVSAGELGLEEPEEVGTTFIENALIKARFAAVGLVYSEELTRRIHAAARAGMHETSADGKVRYRGQHVWLQLMVFINPPVLRLQKHAHVWGGPGCFSGKMTETYELNEWCGAARHAARHAQSGVLKSDELPRRWWPLRDAFRSDEEVGWAPPPCNGEKCPP